MSRGVARREADGRAFVEAGLRSSLTPASGVFSTAGVTGAKSNVALLAWTVGVAAANEVLVGSTDLGTASTGLAEGIALAEDAELEAVASNLPAEDTVLVVASTVPAESADQELMSMALAGNVELEVTNTVFAESADLRLTSTESVERTQMEVASARVEFGSVDGLQNNLQTLLDVDCQVEDRHTPFQASLLYDTDCRSDSAESLAAVGCSGSLGCKVYFQLPAVAASAEALARLDD